YGWPIADHCWTRANCCRSAVGKWRRLSRPALLETGLPNGAWLPNRDWVAGCRWVFSGCPICSTQLPPMRMRRRYCRWSNLVVMGGAAAAPIEEDGETPDGAVEDEDMSSPILLPWSSPAVGSRRFGERMWLSMTGKATPRWAAIEEDSDSMLHHQQITWLGSAVGASPVMGLLSKEETPYCCCRNGEDDVGVGSGPPDLKEASVAVILLGSDAWIMLAGGGHQMAAMAAILGEGDGAPK
ncbi:hypothetical protein ACLOJK_034672, partial [Asimina triloba]